MQYENTCNDNEGEKQFARAVNQLNLNSECLSKRDRFMEEEGLLIR